MDELRERLEEAVSGSHIHDTWSWVDGEEAADAFAKTLVSDLLNDILTTHRIVKRKGNYQGPTHGTLTCYSYHHCRCAECRAANAEQGRKRRRLERERREQG